MFSLIAGIGSLAVGGYCFKETVNLSTKIREEEERLKNNTFPSTELKTMELPKGEFMVQRMPDLNPAIRKKEELVDLHEQHIVTKRKVTPYTQVGLDVSYDGVYGVSVREGAQVTQTQQIEFHEKQFNTYMPDASMGTGMTQKTPIMDLVDRKSILPVNEAYDTGANIGKNMGLKPSQLPLNPHQVYQTRSFNLYGKPLYFSAKKVGNAVEYNAMSDNPDLLAQNMTQQSRQQANATFNCGVLAAGVGIAFLLAAADGNKKK
jgi:hypothetical protein